MFAVLAWLGFAWAQTPDAQQDLYRSLRSLEVHGPLHRRISDPVRFEDGPLQVELRSGWMIPVFSGRFAGEWEEDGAKILREMRREERDAELPAPEERGSKEFVGFVWIGGDGTATAAVDRSADRSLLANELVRKAGEDPSDVAALAHGEVPFRAALKEGLILSIDPKFEALFVGEESSDPFEVVVYGNALGAAAAVVRAQTLFADRTKLYEDASMLVTSWVASDRAAEIRGHGPPEGHTLVVDLNTQRATGLLSAGNGPARPDTWMTLLRDHRGTLSRRWRSMVGSFGRLPSGQPRFARFGGEPFPPSDPSDALSAPAPPARLDPHTADARVLVTPGASQLFLDVEAESRLYVTAVGDTVHWFDLDIPRVETEPETFELVSITDEQGRTLIAERPMLTRRHDAEPEPEPEPEPDPGPEPRPDPEPEPEVEDRRPVVTVRVYLQAPLPAGSSTFVHIKHRDTWPWANWASCGTTIDVRNTGRGSGLQRYLPRPTAAPVGDPWRIRTKVGVPAASKLDVALSGPTTREWSDAQWRWVSVESVEQPALWPLIAVGAWHDHAEPAAKGFPAVRVHLTTNRGRQIETFGPEVRRVLEYYGRWLPPLDLPELEVFESPSGCEGFTWVAPHGMVSVQRVITDGLDSRMGSDATVGGGLRQRRPHLESAVFAHELAHQYWGHVAQPASRDDFWMAESLSEAYACMYVGAAFGEDACAIRMKEYRRTWEGPGMRRATLTDPFVRSGGSVYQYGPYVLEHMLKPRLGVAAYYAALDVLLQDHGGGPITTERLQHYFEQASGKDLGDFFRYWVYQGMVPALELRWRREGGEVVGTVTSDVPFGRFDVPVVAAGVTVWVDVVDGSGTFRVEAPEGKVELDPDGLVLARKRAVRKE